MQRTRRVLGLAAAAVVVLLAGLLLGRTSVRTPLAPAKAQLRFQLAPPPELRFRWTVETQSLAFAPDGNSLAFVAVDGRGTPAIWLRPLADARAHLLPGTEGATSLFWSPDSREIAFFAQGKLSRIGFGGAAPVKICDVPVAGSGLSGSWGQEEIVFSSVMGDAIRRVPIGGGVPETIVEPDEGAGGVRVAGRGTCRTAGRSSLGDARRRPAAPDALHCRRPAGGGASALTGRVRRPGLAALCPRQRPRPAVRRPPGRSSPGSR